MEILIIEDEELAADKLAGMILRDNPDHHILGKIRSVESAVEWFNTNPSPDLLFLDIHLLDGTCFEILNAVEITCPVIFTTAYDTYALEAFQLNSVDYLLKPIRFSKLQQAFQKLEVMLKNFQEVEQGQKLNKVLAALENKSHSYKSRFLIKSGARFIPIAIQDISYFFSEDRITYLLTRQGKKYSVNYSLDDIEQLLDPAEFFRINRQIVLHIDSVEMVHRYFKGRLKVDLIPRFEEDVLVSSRRVADFQAWLDR